MPSKTEKPRTAKTVKSLRIKKARTKTEKSETKLKTAQHKKSTKKTTKKTAPTEKKSTKQHKTPGIEETGCGLAPARVKNVLCNQVLNPREHVAKVAITAAENKPKKARVKEGEEVSTPRQGPQTHISQLPDPVKQVVEEANQAYYQSLMREFERQTRLEMDSNVRTRYDSMKKDAKKEHSKSSKDLQDSGTFNIEAFNRNFNPNFYDKFDANALMDPKMVEQNEWSRANTLISKICVRLSGRADSVLASFIDRIIEQYVENGLVNCVRENKKIMQLSHVLAETDGFSSRVPLSRFVRTLECYERSLNWLKNVDEVKERNRVNRKASKKTDTQHQDEELPEFYNSEYPYDFVIYVMNIYHSVQNRLNESQKSRSKKSETVSVYENIRAGREFKKFGSYLAYETIVRVGQLLKSVVKSRKLKTVSKPLVMDAIEGVHLLVGSDFAPTRSRMLEYLERYKVFCEQRKEKRRAKRKAQETQPAEEQDESDEDLDLDE